MSNIKVSVVVPVYNVNLSYLNECIGSISTQTLNEIEIICVDDGAPLENAKLLDDWAVSDNRIIVIHQENAGASAARNAGLDRCSGKYVTFVDSDDYISVDYIEKAYTRAEEDNLELLLWGSYKLYPNEKVEYGPFNADIRLFDDRHKEFLELKTMSGVLPIYDEICTKYGSGSCCSKLYRLDMLRKHNLRYPVGIKRSEDVNFNIRVFDKASRIGYMNEHMYYYRQLADSATYVYRENGISVLTEALVLLREFIRENNKSDYFAQVYYMRCMFCFLESMDMDYLHPDNPKPFGVRMREMRNVANQEPYKEAFEKLKYANLSTAKKIPLMLIKLKRMEILALFYSVYKKITPK